MFTAALMVGLSLTKAIALVALIPFHFLYRFDRICMSTSVFVISPPARPGCSRCCARRIAAQPRTRWAGRRTPRQRQGTGGRSEPAEHAFAHTQRAGACCREFALYSFATALTPCRHSHKCDLVSVLAAHQCRCTLTACMIAVHAWRKYRSRKGDAAGWLLAGGDDKTLSSWDAGSEPDSAAVSSCVARKPDSGHKLPPGVTVPG